MEGNTVQQPLSKYLIIDTAGFIKNPPLQEFGQNLITLREVIGKKHMQWRPTGQCTQCTCTGYFLPSRLSFCSNLPQLGFMAFIASEGYALPQKLRLGSCPGLCTAYLETRLAPLPIIEDPLWLPINDACMSLIFWKLSAILPLNTYFESPIRR